MDPKVALQMFYSLIEQTNAAGAFKKLPDLDSIRSAHSCLVAALDKIPTNEKTV